MRTLLTALALAPAALGLAACGGDDNGGGGGPAVTFKKGQPVHVKGQEYKFDPGNIVIEGGGPTTVEFENSGSLAHNLEIQKNSAKVASSPTFQGGETKSFSANLPPGEYTILCTVGDHAQLGMKGKLTVK